MKNDLRITYPRSNFKVLNNEVIKYINTNIEEFMNYSQESVQNFPYSLYIYYDEYETNNYISYVFYNSMFTGGAHPNNTIYTINYDKNTNKIVNINDLVSDNPNILNTFSYQSRIQLGSKKEFQDPNIKEMLIEGTKPVKENFKNFAFTKDGIILYFEQYQVAPYYMGAFKILIK